jgi:hypothetical protein
MFNFTKKSSKPARKQRQTRQLATETLEDRQMMTVTYHGGALLQRVETQNLFMGRDWYYNATYNQMRGQLDQANANLVGGPFMDMLRNDADYRVGRGSAVRGVTEPLNIDKRYYLTDQTIRHNLQAYIKAGYVAQPDANRLYIVYTEPGAYVWNGQRSDTSFDGYHSAFYGQTAAGYAADVHYAVIVYPNCTQQPQIFNNYFDQLTYTTSHEVAEAVTDPNDGYRLKGWYDDGVRGGLGEIGDIANGSIAMLNGYCITGVAAKNDATIYPNGATRYPGATYAAPAAAAGSAEMAPAPAMSLQQDHIQPLSSLHSPLDAVLAHTAHHETDIDEELLAVLASDQPAHHTPVVPPARGVALVRNS